MGVLTDIKKAVWPERGMRKKLAHWRNVILNRTSKRDLLDGLKRLGVKEGDALYVHSSLSGLGHVPGGAETVIEALLEAVGGASEGTLAMPAFSMSGSMKHFIDKAERIDLRTQPSEVGRLTDIFWRMEGVRRSAHPTHSSAAIGKYADYILSDHERAVTPYAAETPIAKFCRLENSYFLGFNSSAFSVLHVAQEQIDYPGLYFPEIHEVPFIDRYGNQHTIRTKLMVPTIPTIVVLPNAAEGKDKPFFHLIDYLFDYPDSRRDKVKDTDYYKNYIDVWLKREKSLRERGILKDIRIGRAQIALLTAGAFLEFIKEDLGTIINENPYDQNPETIKPLIEVFKEIRKHAKD